MITYTLEEAENIHLGADLHLGHTRIISLADRPFKTVYEMDYKLTHNWNSTIKPNDIAYHLGDFSRYPLDWIWKLNGYVILIRGNHDGRFPRCLMKPYEIIHVEGEKLLLIHNYQDAPRDWDGWIVHGHNHGKSPLIMPYRKRINVSVEVTGYRPVSLARIVELIKNGDGK